MKFLAYNVPHRSREKGACVKIIIAAALVASAVAVTPQPEPKQPGIEVREVEPAGSKPIEVPPAPWERTIEV